MAGGGESNVPRVRIKRPTINSADRDIEAANNDSTNPDVRRHHTRRHQSSDQLPRSRSVTPHNVYHGSFAHSSRASTPTRSPPPASPGNSIYNTHLADLLPEDSTLDLNDYGLEESRDGFFDATFLAASPSREHSEPKHATAPERPGQILFTFHENALQLVRDLAHFARSRAAIKLLKSFLGVFIAYIISLIPPCRQWLGAYPSILPLSALINHPGRSVGSQIDGLVLTILGTVAGLGWGSFALYVSATTKGAKEGHGGVLAVFLIVFTAAIGFLRCVFMRFYQVVIAAGVAICYVCLAHTGSTVGWRKVFDYGVPWALGQGLAMLVSLVVFPSAGARSVGICFHDALKAVEKGMVLPRDARVSDGGDAKQRRELELHFVKLSTAVRDFTIEFTFSRFTGEVLRQLRNSIQGLIRSTLSIKAHTTLFDELAEGQMHELDSTHAVRRRLGEPMRRLLVAMQESVHLVNTVMLLMTGLEPASLRGAKTIKTILQELLAAKEIFDEADTLLLQNDDIQTAYKASPETIELFLFVHPIRQMANNVEALLRQVSTMQGNNPKWRIRAPSYPWHKAIDRSNAQVRHDRGGLTAGFYFRTKTQLERTVGDMLGRAYVPTSKRGIEKHASDIHDTKKSNQRPSTYNVRHALWEVVHRFQGFESRFALKVTLVTTLLSIPAWLPQSQDWWNDSEAWWTVMTVWLMMHPRVGGTFQDLFTRCFCAILGAIWAGLANHVNNRNPYVVAVFAAIYLIPMIHRFTQSSHPRSGFIGCVSFIVISLDIYTKYTTPSSFDRPSIVKIAWTRGLAFVVGIIAAVIVNWILWPFVARHELRKSISAMMLHAAILYRGVIAKYVYYSEGEEPGKDDVQRSELLEGRLREGFVRMRQLIDMAGHEIRLRAPFNPVPYSALISSLERLFNHLVQVRQSSLYFHPHLLTPDPSTIRELTTPRRDAVAVILMNMYILSSALRADQKVPRYLPSAAAARKKLLERMEGIEAGYEARIRAEDIEREAQDVITRRETRSRRRRWEDVYHYAYSAALTDIVEEMQVLQRLTREVCGSVEWS